MLSLEFMVGFKTVVTLGISDFVEPFITNGDVSCEYVFFMHKVVQSSRFPKNLTPVALRVSGFFALVCRASDCPLLRTFIILKSKRKGKERKKERIGEEVWSTLSALRMVG
jgi:hypothetical protein